MAETLVYSAMEAAKVLKEDPGSFNERLERGEIPAYKRGKNWKIPKTLLQASIESEAINEAKERRRIYEETKQMEPKKV